nr:recombinase family protein [Tessaracoccus bendigoensis]
MSGRTMSRPGLEAYLTYLCDGDVLVIYSLSRLGRSTAATLELLEDLRGRGVRVVSIAEQIDTGSAMGRFVTTLLAALAEMEAELTQERVLAGLAAARERGG